MNLRRLRPYSRILPAACIFGLAALGLMLWSLFDPRPMPVIVAMSVGQVLGTLSLMSFLLVVVADLSAQIEHKPIESLRPPAKK